MATHTQAAVVGVFKSISDARAVVADLRASGVELDEIYISSEEALPRSSLSAGGARHEGRFTGWLKRTFGDNEGPDRHRYENAFRSGNVLVSVETRNEDVNAIADILRYYCPLEQECAISATDSAAALSAAAAGAGVGSSIARRGTSGFPVQEELNAGTQGVQRGGVRVFPGTVNS